jgi:hypothetical protein
MDLRRAASILLRHWALLAVGLVLSLCAATYARSAVAPKFEAEAAILFTSPSTTWDAEGHQVDVNPFTRAGTAERLAASTVIAVANTPDWKRRMVADGALGSYSYRLTSELIVEVRAQASTAAQAMHTLSTAVRFAEDELRERQEAVGAPAGTLIGSDVLPYSENATELLAGRLKAAVSVGLLGLAVSASMIFLVDAFLPPRPLRRLVAVLPMRPRRAPRPRDDVQPAATAEEPRHAWPTIASAPIAVPATGARARPKRDRLLHRS